MSAAWASCLQATNIPEGRFQEGEAVVYQSRTQRGLLVMLVFFFFHILYTHIYTSMFISISMSVSISMSISISLFSLYAHIYIYTYIHMYIWIDICTAHSEPERLSRSGGLAEVPEDPHRQNSRGRWRGPSH